MSDDQKKPKDIKDLKSRLGRTAAPGASMPPGGIAPPAGMSFPPGIMPPRASAPPGIAPPVAAPPSLSPPPASAPAPAALRGPALQAPPFGQPQQAAAPAPAPVKRPMDPFAAQPNAVSTQGPREVRLIIDEKPVDDAEIGRKQRGRNAGIIAIGLVAGLAVGYMGGFVMKDRSLWNRSVRDGKDVYASVDEASKTVDKAKHLIDQIVAKAHPQTPGTAPSVDFAAIEELRGLKKPFEANAFARKNYNTFNPATVDALFDYQTNVGALWDRMAILANRTLNASARAELQKAAETAGGLTTTQYGMIPREVEGGLVGSLVFVDPPAPGSVTADSKPTKATVHASRGGAAGEKEIYTGQDLSKSPSNYVVLVDSPSSVAVLGQGATAFAEYLRWVTELKQMMDHTSEVQGTLISGLGDVAKNSEVFAF